MKKFWFSEEKIILGRKQAEVSVNITKLARCVRNASLQSRRDDVEFELTIPYLCVKNVRPQSPLTGFGVFCH